MKVCNWDKWQTFRKDRGAPPWIKVHRNLLTNEQWVDLSDSEKGQLVSIWMLAADKDGVIPDSSKMIQKMAMLDSLPNISKFIELGFLSTTCQPPDNQEIKPCPQHGAPEEKRVEESRGDKSKDITASIDAEISDLFEAFWLSGIKKVNKKKAKVIFTKIIKSETNKHEFNSGLIFDVKNRLKLNQMGFAEMHPTTYLNGERWKDDYPENKQHYQQLSTTERTTQENRESYERTQREIAELEAQINDEEALGSVQQGTWSELQ